MLREELTGKILFHWRLVFLHPLPPSSCGCFWYFAFGYVHVINPGRQWTDLCMGAHSSQPSLAVTTRQCYVLKNLSVALCFLH